MGVELQASIGIAMNRLGRERGQAYRNVLGAARLGRAIPHPFTGRRNDGLSCANIQHAAVVFDPQESAEHNRDLLEPGPLTGFAPTLR